LIADAEVEFPTALTPIFLEGNTIIDPDRPDRQIKPQPKANI
jgi:hypothetical protein